MSVEVDAIASFLTTSSVAGGSTGWTIHKLGTQDSPDQSVTIFVTGGDSPEQATDRRWRRPTFQIVTRAAAGDAQTANLKAMEILTTLDRAAVNGFDYFLASQSAPFPIGPDQNGRPLFSVNFRSAET